MSSEPTIVKVQRPLGGNMEMWLVYAEGRLGIQHVHETYIPRYVKDAMAASYKGYFTATQAPGIGWVLGQRVGDQNW